MEDWEDEALPSVIKVERAKSSWDDEDEKDVKESWEDEDEPMVPEPEREPKSLKKVALDPIAMEHHHQERVVKEADFQSKQDLSGEKSEEKTLDNFIPKSESDFLEYADLISHKLHPYENSTNYIGLLKDVVRLSTIALHAGDAKEVVSSVAAIANEKLKVEKETDKKKIVAKKKQLHVEKESDDDYAFT